MKKLYYSQHGEDNLLWQVFGDKTDGYFVDIGALDGTFFSNTYSFAQHGWKGICVEAHPHFYPILQKNRPESVNVHVAIGNKNEKNSPFYAAGRGSFSSLYPAAKNFFTRKFKHFGVHYKQTTVDQSTLTSLFDAYLPPGQSVDFMTIDIEGCEFIAMKELNLNKYRPRIILSEFLDSLNKKQLPEMTEYLSKFGYKQSRIVKQNVFYCLADADKKILDTASLKCDLIRTERPIDFIDGK